MKPKQKDKSQRKGETKSASDLLGVCTLLQKANHALQYQTLLEKSLEDLGLPKATLMKKKDGFWYLALLVAMEKIQVQSQQKKLLEELQKQCALLALEKPLGLKIQVHPGQNTTP